MKKTIGGRAHSKSLGYYETMKIHLQKGEEVSFATMKSKDQIIDNFKKLANIDVKVHQSSSNIYKIKI